MSLGAIKKLKDKKQWENKFLVNILEIILIKKMYVEINEIYKSSNKSSSRSLITKILKRLAEWEFNSNHSVKLTCFLLDVIQ